MAYEDVTDIQRRYSHVGGRAVSIKDFDLLKVCLFVCDACCIMEGGYIHRGMNECCGSSVVPGA